jgi:ectoine hydroxylase-related dioxygenase (phytanoyl-CoA dioxygenase family)
MKNNLITFFVAALAFSLFSSEKEESVDMRKVGELHDKSYSQSLDYYKGLTDLMRDMRKSIQSFVLEGKEVESFDVSVIGPTSISGPMLSSLSKESSILDVGCATGDHLLLMQEEGYKDLTGVDIASGMVEEARKHPGIEFIQADFLEFSPGRSYDLVYAQAFIHLFPKKMLPEVLEKLLKLSNQRLYFTTTVHETPSEGVELKQDVHRYRSRYTSEEILGAAKELLKNDPHLCFHYFYLTDPLGKRWINCVIEKKEIRQMYQDEGVFLYKQFIDPQNIQGVVAEIDSMAVSLPAPNTIIRYDGEKVFDRIENFIPYCSQACREVVHSSRLLNLVSTLIGEKVLLFKDKINFKLPGSAPFVPHQDAAAGWDRYGPIHVSAAIHFDAAHAANGALYFAPGAHKKGLLSPLKEPLSTETVNSLDWQMVAADPGDVLFFDSFTPHYSNGNRTQEARRVAFLTYMPEKYGDHREMFFQEKRERQPSMDERNEGDELVRDAFGKLVRKE